LATATREQYEAIRRLTPTIVDDTPFYEDLAEIEKYLKKYKNND
jgi:histidine ammonia-lyase